MGWRGETIENSIMLWLKFFINLLFIEFDLNPEAQLKPQMTVNNNYFDEQQGENIV